MLFYFSRLMCILNVQGVYMITKLSEAFQISSVLKNWNGKQCNQIPTSNSKIQKFHSTGEDSLMNVVLFKFLAQYDFDAYKKMLEIGVSVFYQTARFDITKKNNLIICQVYNKINQESGLIHVDEKTIYLKQKFGINGNRSTVFSMFDYNQMGESREIVGL